MNGTHYKIMCSDLLTIVTSTYLNIMKYFVTEL